MEQGPLKLFEYDDLSIIVSQNDLLEQNVLMDSRVKYASRYLRVKRFFREMQIDMTQIARIFVLFKVKEKLTSI